MLYFKHMTGVAGNMSFEVKRCWATLKKNDCDYDDCRSMCLKKNPKGHGRCIKSFQERIICSCSYPCPD